MWYLAGEDREFPTEGEIMKLRRVVVFTSIVLVVLAAGTGAEAQDTFQAGDPITDWDPSLSSTSGTINITGTKRINVIATGCPGSSCVDFDITGNAGTVPADTPTWSSIKAQYRSTS